MPAKKKKGEPKQSEVLTLRCVPQFKELCDAALPALGVSFAELIRLGVTSVVTHHVEKAMGLDVLKPEDYLALETKRQVRGWPGVYAKLAEALRIMERNDYLIRASRSDNASTGVVPVKEPREEVPA